MARQSGHIKYKGTIGDIRHFKIKGLSGHFAGLIGGPDGERVKTAPEFKRTRENMNEFGGCAAVGKSVRTGLSRLMKQMADPQVTGRLTGIMKKINIEDQSEKRGYRAILVTQQPQYLVGFNFNRLVSFESVFAPEMSFANNVDRNESTLTIQAFDPLSTISAPAGATHFRIIHALSALSDFAFNATSGMYEPIEANLNEVNRIAYSAYLPLDEAVSVPLEITATLPGDPVMTENMSVLESVGIEFFQFVNGEYYLFNSGNALKVQRIF